MAFSTFNVSDVLLKLAEQEGIYLSVEGVDDVCYGCVIAADKTFNSFLAQHALPYNWQIIDGYPIRIVRRPINDSLTIDHTISQDDCVVSGGPAVSVKRVDVSELPRELEIQYIDPDRQFATTTRTARHVGAPTTNPGTSIEIDFLISATQAREMAFDTLYRIWAQQLSLSFEHRDITIEPGDTVHITCDQGVYVVLVQEATYTVARTTQVLATVLLASSGVTLPPGEYDLWPTSPDQGATSSPDWPASMSGRATFAGVGEMSVSGDIVQNPEMFTSAAFAGAGNLTVTATIVEGPEQLQGTAAFAGVGNLTVAATIAEGPEQLQGTAAFVGSGQMTATSYIMQSEDSATTTWVAAVVSAGGTVSGYRKSLVNDLIIGLKADSLWDKLDRLWLFAAENSQSALIDLVATSTASLVATDPTFTADQGFTGNESGYIDTGFNATVGTNKFLRNDAHYSMWVAASQTFDSNLTMCGTTGTTAARWMYLVGTAGHYRQINDNGIGGAYTNPPSFVGHILVSRPSSTTSKHYHDGSSFQTASATSTGVTNANFCVLWDGAYGDKSSIKTSAFSIGGNLDGGSDASNFYNRLHTYMMAIGL